MHSLTPWDDALAFLMILLVFMGLLGGLMFLADKVMAWLVIL